jgi:hypothetical protein
MRLIQLRFTIRRMMAVVAIVAIALGLVITADRLYREHISWRLE